MKSAMTGPNPKYPLIEALYAKTVELFTSSQPDDKHPYRTPCDPLADAAAAVIQSDDDLARLIHEGLEAAKDPLLDQPAGGCIWGISVSDVVLLNPGEGPCATRVSQVVEILFHDGITQMIGRRRPELELEGVRRLEEWEDSRACAPSSA